MTNSTVATQVRLFFQRTLRIEKLPSMQVWQVFSRAMDLPEDQWALMNTAEVIVDACIQLDSILMEDEGAELSREHWTDTISEIRNTFDINTLTKTWDQISHIYGLENLNTLQAIDTYLRARNITVNIDEDEIFSIQDGFESLKEKISQLNADPDIIDFMNAHIESVVFALRNYEIYSIDGLWSVSMSMFTELYRPRLDPMWSTPDADEGKTDIKQRLSGLLKRLVKTLENAERIDKGMDAIKGIADKFDNLLK